MVDTEIFAHNKTIIEREGVCIASRTLSDLQVGEFIKRSPTEGYGISSLTGILVTNDLRVSYCEEIISKAVNRLDLLIRLMVQY